MIGHHQGVALICVLIDGWVVAKNEALLAHRNADQRFLVPGDLTAQGGRIPRGDFHEIDKTVVQQQRIVTAIVLDYRYLSYSYCSVFQHDAATDTPIVLDNRCRSLRRTLFIVGVDRHRRGSVCSNAKIGVTDTAPFEAPVAVDPVLSGPPIEA